MNYYEMVVILKLILKRYILNVAQEQIHNEYIHWLSLIWYPHEVLTATDVNDERRV